MKQNDLPDFANASLEELQAMQSRLSTFVEKRLETRRRDALQQIKDLVKQFDLSYEEVVQVIRTSTKRGKAVAIYRNPDKPRQTWSGKGTAPDWFANHPDPESLRIPGA